MKRETLEIIALKNVKLKGKKKKNLLDGLNSRGATTEDRISETDISVEFTQSEKQTER